MEAVCQAIGLEPKDLFVTEEQIARPQSRIAATYSYRDEKGNLLYQVVRFDPKDFRQRRPDGRGGWLWSTKGTRRVLYRLPELLAAGASAWVFIVEGEKDADNLAALGLVATCNPGGAGKWQDAYAEHLHGRRVAIIPDRDEPGWTHAQEVAEHLQGVAATARIVDLRQVQGFQGKDVSDWIEWRDSSATEDLVASLTGMAEAASEHQQAVPAPIVQPGGWQPFPVDALPAACRRFVREAAEALGVDTSYVALPVLAGLAAAIGNSRRIALSRSWAAPAVVWAGVVGESGTLKSPAIKIALGPIYRRQVEALEAFRKAMDAYKAETHAHRLAMKDWEKSGRKNGEAAPTAPEKPVMQRFYCSDTTVEALAERLEDAPRGLLVARDELSGWLGSFGQYKQGKGRDEANWLSMFDAGPLVVDRKTGEKPIIYVPRAAACIVGGIQPGILRRMFTAEHYESGLAARFLLAMPPRRPKQWTDREVSRVTEQGLASVFASLWGLAPVNADGEEAKPMDLPLADEARPLWVGFVNRHGRETADLAGPVAAAFSKLEGYAARLALVLSLARWAENPGTLGIGPVAVDVESVRAGIEIVEWAKQETLRIYAMLSEDDQELEYREVLELVERRGGTITVRELQRAQHHKNAEEAEELLRAMAADGLGRWVDLPPGPKGGRPTSCFQLYRGDQPKT
jgi:5S rRNA maturation endonuclease (ribonuclease M5)